MEKAVQVIDFAARPRIYRAAKKLDAPSRILACGLFAIDEIRVSRGVELPAGASCSTGTLVEGSFELASEGARLDLRCGDSFVIPAETSARLENQGPRQATAVLTEIV